MSENKRRIVGAAPHILFYIPESTFVEGLLLRILINANQLPLPAGVTAEIVGFGEDVHYLNVPRMIFVCARSYPGSMVDNPKFWEFWHQKMPIIVLIPEDLASNVNNHRAFYDAGVERVYGLSGKMPEIQELFRAIFSDENFASYLET